MTATKNRAAGATRTGRLAIVYGATAGLGGLGSSAAVGITAAANGGASTFALGPGAASGWSFPRTTPAIKWIQSPAIIPPWRARYTWLRWRTGRLTMLHDQNLGRWAAQQIQKLKPDAGYLFSQIALETLEWARFEGVPTALENPNSHIRNFRDVCERESERWFGRKFLGHPTTSMVDRVEEEYRLADRIRISSEWGKDCMVRGGVPRHKIQVIHQAVDLERFIPPSTRPPQDGPLRLCYVGSVELRKGFPYLLRAIRSVGGRHVSLRIVGATGDRHSARLLARESAGLQIQCGPGDPLPVYQESELFVLPSVEDGFGLVVAEAMGCGLPVIVSRQAGAAECVQAGRSGWIVPAADVESLAAALEDALQRRKDLHEMGRQARADIERSAGPAQIQQLSDWLLSPFAKEVVS